MKDMKSIITRVIGNLFQLTSTFAASILTTSALVELAYSERGYVGVGGEWIIIILANIFYIILFSELKQKYIKMMSE